MAIDLTKLTAEDIAGLKALLGVKEAEGARSPVWKPLSDMRAPTTTKGRLNRPHFEWSAEDDGHTFIPAYPTLYWDDHGVERRIESAEAEKQIPATWKPYPPRKAAIVDPLVKAQEEFDALSPEDQQFVLQAQKQARLNRLNEMMSALTDTQLAAMNTKQPEKSKK